MPLRFLDVLSDPIFVLAERGDIVHTNHAAAAAYGEFKDEPFELASLENAIRRVQRGEATVEFTLKYGSGQNLKSVPAKLFEHMGHDNFLMLLPARPEEAQSAAIRSFLTLARAQLVAPMGSLAQELKLIQPAEGPEAPLAVHCQSMAEKLEKLVALIEVFGPDAIVGTDRVMASDWVQDSIDALRGRVQSSNVSILFDAKSAPEIPMYGNRIWLVRALSECLDNAIRFARADISLGGSAYIEITLKAHGMHMTAVVANHGASYLQLHPIKHENIRPFNSLQPDLDAQHPGLRIGLALTQKILELHGGRLKLHRDMEGVISFILELPIGAPVAEQDELDLTQAQYYAEDLKQLMLALRHSAKR